MPSILNSKARKVLTYLNKHGFKDIKLTIYIFESNIIKEDLVKLEQYFFDTLKPNLNMTLIASATYNLGTMSLEARDKLRIERGIPIFIYDVNNLNLLYIFDSKQDMYNKIHIHHKTLNKCLDIGDIYLDSFFLSLDYIDEFINKDIISIDKLIKLVEEKRKNYIIIQPKAKKILAEFKDNPNKNRIFNSINELSKELKGDKKTIRDYLNGNRDNYYRGV